MIMSNLATVITGASSGIGEQLAKQLAAQEQQTLVLVARSADKLQTLAEQLKQAHPIRVEVIRTLHDKFKFLIAS